MLSIEARVTPRAVGEGPRKIYLLPKLRYSSWQALVEAKVVSAYRLIDTGCGSPVSIGVIVYFLTNTR